MTTAFYLLPGARLPRTAAARLLETLSSSEACALAAIGRGAGDTREQRLAGPAFARMPHFSWIWRVLGRSAEAPSPAPYDWLDAGGPPLDAQIWTLEPYALDERGRIKSASPAASTAERIAQLASIEPILQRASCRLQILEDRWFVSRRENWAAEAAPLEAAVGLHPEALRRSGPDADRISRLEGELFEALRRAGASRDAAGLWFGGGGRPEPLFPPTTIRTLAADEGALRGYARAAGVPDAAICRVGSDRSEWPKAPEGDSIVVISELYPAWLAEDWQSWRKALPRAAERLEKWRDAARSRRCSDHVTVLFGRMGAATLLPRRRSALDFLRAPANQKPEAWIVDSYEEDLSLK